MTYLILARSDRKAKGLAARLKSKGVGASAECDDSEPRVVLWDGRDSLAVAQAYSVLSSRLEDAAYGHGSGGESVTVVVEALKEPDLLNVVSENGGWESLVAMMVLTFPEFRWVFGLWGKSAQRDDASIELGRQHDLALADDEWSDPLYDPTGLRNWVRERTNSYISKELRDDLKLPVRENLAAVIEDEHVYRHFNSYCAYRFGLRADIVDSWKKMHRRFGSKNQSHGYWLLLEDMSLNFADRKKPVKLHDLESERAEHCPQLGYADPKSKTPQSETSQFRVLVTTGQTRPGDTTFQRNIDYLRRKSRESGGFGEVVTKPASGIFDLWTQAGLMAGSNGVDARGFAPGFLWPPEDPASYEEKKDGHGSPGKLLLVAEKLIDRATRIGTDAISVREAVLGATLATDALELTGCRTPTTSLEALSLKHQFEVIAECQFSGVEHHLLIKDRLAELRKDVEAISKWFDEEKRERALLNGTMHIINQLIGILREYNQFSEEQECMVEARKLHSTLWLAQQHGIPRVILKPFVGYGQTLLASFPRFIGIVGVWIIILTALQFTFDYSLSDFDLDHPIRSLGQATLTYIETLPQIAISYIKADAPLTFPLTARGFPSAVDWLNLIAVVSSFLHLGILVSHLYTIVSRK